MGRPTKYSEAILAKTQHYIDNHLEHNDLVPSMAGLSVTLDVSRDCLYKWSKEEGKEEFLYMLGQLQKKQEKLLLNGGLGGDYNSNITKLMLAKHGYVERQDITSKGEKVIPPIINFNKTYEADTELPSDKETD